MMRLSLRLAVVFAVVALVGAAAPSHAQTIVYYNAPATPVVSYYTPPSSVAAAPYGYVPRRPVTVANYYAAPSVSYYAPPSVSYYAPPAPAAVSYYAAPSYVPYCPPTTTSAYYAPSYSSFYAPAFTSFYAPTTSYYAPVTSFYAPTCP